MLLNPLDYLKRKEEQEHLNYTTPGAGGSYRVRKPVNADKFKAYCEQKGENRLSIGYFSS